jgi:cellulose synthase (UDP-forming)
MWSGPVRLDASSLRAAGHACGLEWERGVFVFLLSVVLRRLPPGRPGEWIAGFVRRWFPHVDAARPRLSDLIRIPVQTAWLLLVRTDAPARKRSWRAGIAARRDGVFQALSAWLPRRQRELIERWLADVRIALHIDVDTVRSRSEAYAQHSVWDRAAVRYIAFPLAGVLAFVCVTTPFSLLAQTTFVAIMLGLALWLRRIPGPLMTLLLVVLSVVTSTRYLWWRLTSTLNWDDAVSLIWGIVLVIAEVYTWVVLLLGYIQTAWPLRRTPTPLPEDTALWPSVDVFIPTYNEPLKVVMPTVYAALGIDWPRDKINIYLLDDGRRAEFRAFAEEAGVGYMIRDDNRHAKAGNLNAAMKKAGGDYIAIFDCDHIPTRSFLQSSMGWFLKDPKLALLQTPHHFFSPDPFERNLGLFRRMPNEGELFYGLIQDGNDLWNATFFCGSCAVIKRSALEEVGGIAVETVTEDAHTALKLQRLGYTSAYINLPQAAGLATESLSAHIGQRIRWARGMAQIFRLDNPFFGKGLSWAQRICYGNAMLHFLNGGPRLVFLTAPLAFLLFHTYVIYTPAIAVALYVLPHMAHANITNSRIQGSHRHSFWAEVYETVLAWYIVRPTTVALLDPHKGKFNVTAKGGLVDEDYFDWTISVPYLVIVGANLLGFGFGIWRLVWGPADEVATTVMNLFWTVYNILLLGAAIAVASETRQVRRSHRVKLQLPAIVHLPGGHLIRGTTLDFSEGGAALTLSAMPEIAPDELVHVSLRRGEEEFLFPARIVAVANPQLRLRWELTDAEQQAALVQCTFSRADAWVSWAEGRAQDAPLAGLRRVLSVGLGGYRRVAEMALPARDHKVRRASAVAAWLSSLLPRNPRPL